MLKKLITKFFHISFLFTRPLTMGVRVILLDQSKTKVLLVNHTYVDGWHFPGGGVDAGETIEDAALRELREECSIAPTNTLTLHAVHFHKKVNNRDHVAVFHGLADEETLGFTPSREIKEAKFYPLDNLPSTITEPTRQRLEEFAGQRAISPYWSEDS